MYAVEGTEAPSTRGGRAAATTSVSAAAVAKVLSGVNFPKNKDELRDYAQRHTSKAEVIDREASNSDFASLEDFQRQ
jgi:Protein of unknown function (DUF2795)